MSPRIRALLDAGRLIEQSSPDEQVAGLWRDGMGAYAFACSPDRPAGQRLAAVHDVARMASLALLRAANLRERVKGDRETALAAAGLLGADGLPELLATIPGVRSDRNPESAISVSDVETLIPIARELLIRMRGRIIALRPAIVGDLAPILDVLSE